ncbi:MAG: YihY/virulence factor BrkB family protein [Bacteroidetes bacterium]|nr:YihY/virulence factor BrkB family protein [Bacteroidota bacterium]
MAILNIWKRWNLYLSKEIWEINDASLTGWKRRRLNSIKIITAAVNGFIADKAAVRASALTFYTLLSVVPVLAVAFAIAKGFGLEQILEEQIRETFAGQQEIVDQLIAFSHSSLQNTQGGLIAGISVVFLIWSIIKLLNHIESAFNTVWNIDQARPILRKFTEYLTIILVGPVFIILSGSVTYFIESSLNTLSESSMVFGGGSGVKDIVAIVIKLIPSFVIAILFTLIYLIIPNKLVKFKPAAIAGILVGIAFTFLQIGYVYFQLAMSRYNAIYGSFAALPLFLIWLQTSWTLILFGAEVSYAIHYKKSYKPWDVTAKLSPRKKRILTLSILQLIIKSYQEGTPKTLSQLASDSHLPDKQVRMALDLLLQTDLILTTETRNKTKYVPAKPGSLITLYEANKLLDEFGENTIPVNVDDIVNINNALAEREKEFARKGQKSFDELIG